MPMSLAKLDEKIGTEQRALESLLTAKGEALESVSKLAEAIDALEAIESPTAEQKAELDSKYAALKDARKQANKLADQVREAEASISQLDRDRELAVEQNRQEANLRKPSNRSVPPENATGAGNDVVVKDYTDAQKDHDLVGWLRATFLSSQDKVPIRTVLAGESGYANYKNDRLLAAMTQSGNPSVIPPNQATRLIELLRAKTVVRQLPGVRQIPLENGNLTLPRQTGTATAGYGGEMAYTTPTDQSTDSLALAAKKLTVMTVQSGELLRRSNPSTDAMIRDDLVQAVALKEDATFIRNTANLTTNPKGLKYFADQVASSANAIAANATVNLANVTNDIKALLNALMNVDTPMNAPAWIMAPRSRNYLAFLRDGNGNLAFPEVLAQNTLFSYPIFTTTQIPINLGGGTNASEVYLVDSSELLIADTPTMMLSMSDVAAYYDGAAVKASYSEDSVVFRLIVEHDTQLRHPRSCAYLSAVLWI